MDDTKLMQWIVAPASLSWRCSWVWHFGQANAIMAKLLVQWLKKRTDATAIQPVAFGRATA
jgi:hypothetical protein